MIGMALFGAGRIGRMHGRNLAHHPAYELRYVVDVHAEAANEVATATGARVAGVDEALADPSVGSVLIASSTDTHADLIEAAARAGKAILCEKPIDLAIDRVESCLEVVRDAGLPLMVGFNRRFDANFRRLRQTIDEGRIGEVEIVAITSRDPGPPGPDYIKVSGGLFRDMMIHDFDMARFLLPEEPVEVSASGSSLVDPAIGELGDIDTAVVTLRTESGRLCQIQCSRRASYGYDQRIEVHGSRASARAENVRLDTVEVMDADGFHGALPPHFFIERYAAAYLAELDHFADCVRSGRPPSPSGDDGRRALALADAALDSLQSGRLVRL
ncbi:MAG: inositol 2-dehydrogenase [Geminicoccaceae bacterium]|nr:inositol 2-dehydrogenase [Geminicoccaceae bacterium]